LCARRKKKGLRLNGKAGIHIKTLHGTFVFAEQRLLWADGSDSRYLAATLQEAESVGLQEFGVYFCNRLSFHEVAALLERVSGVPLVCEQTLWNWVQARAALRDARLAQDLTACQALSFPELADTVDLYAAEAEEVLILTDGIGVKAQKPTRQKAGTPACTKLDKRHDTHVLLLERPDGRFEYLAGSIDGKISLVATADAALRRTWGQRATPLPVVALSDGARKIRQDLTELLGCCVTVILDWYHLAKRVYEHLSMCAHSRTEREDWQRQVLGCLWQGRVAEALSFLSALSVRNLKVLGELVGYLQKHATEIIDYARRAAVGKPIGSGRMEKAVDQVIGMRQKKKGMSWTEQGSRALAVLKIAELNRQWQQLWNMGPTAA
jgi:hypothetical protein